MSENMLEDIEEYSSEKYYRKSPHFLQEHEIKIHRALHNLNIPTIIPLTGIIERTFCKRKLFTMDFITYTEKTIVTPFQKIIDWDSLSIGEKQNIKDLIALTFKNLSLYKFNHGDLGAHNILIVREPIVYGHITSSVKPLIIDFEYSSMTIDGEHVYSPSQGRIDNLSEIYFY